jgi:nitrilase
MGNSLSKESPEMDRIRAAAKEAGIFVVLGYSERDGASLYIAQSFIDTSGEIIHHCRKIKRTHVERSIWGDRQADSLKSVTDTLFGKVGGFELLGTSAAVVEILLFSECADSCCWMVANVSGPCKGGD